MEIHGTRPDGSLDVSVERGDGVLRSVLQAARAIAVAEQQVVHLAFNGRLIAVGPKTTLKHIERIYHFGKVPPDQEIGPEPAPEDVPYPEHGSFVIDVSTER